MNNRDNEDNDNTIANIFIGLFSVVIFIGIVCFCVLIYFKFMKGKKLFKHKYTDNYLMKKHVADNYLMKKHVAN